MGKMGINLYYLISFHILLLLLFMRNNTASASASTHDFLAERRLQDDGGPCSKVFCGEGHCVNSTTSILGFDCICNPGWSKPQWEIFVLPACTLPNCTINSSECGKGAPPAAVLPPPPPVPPANPPPLNLLSPCNLVWCGDGTCVLNGLGYYCKCNEGSANVLNISGAACLSECFLGADCKGVYFGPGPSGGTPNSPPAQPGNGIGPFGSPASPPAIPNYGGNTTNSLSDRRQVTRMMVIICLIFLSLI